MGTDTLQALHHAIDLAFAQRSAELAQRAIDLDQREAALAEAAEHYSLDTRIAAAMAQERTRQLERVSSLIDLQLEHLAPKSAAALVLRNLKKLITDPQ